VDENYVGDPPPLEVTICNLDDNIDKAFLSDMVRVRQQITFKQMHLRS
jgi:histone-lysine N-methyltransferase SETD1